jgi:uncharacterized membrane protein
MEARPKLKIELSKTDRLLEWTSLLLLAVLWTGTIAFFSKLPDQIPSHFDAAGQADDFSHKKSIFVLPIISTVLYAGMTILNRYPHIFNYPTIVTAENARRLYTSATRLVRVLKLVVVVIFSGIVFMTYKISLSDTEGLGAWFLPVVVGLMLLPVIFYIVKRR